MGLDAVIFDWGGTLTPWHTIDGALLWSAVCEPHFLAAAAFAAALYAAESQLWRAALDSQRSATWRQSSSRLAFPSRSKAAAKPPPDCRNALEVVSEPVLS